VTGGISAVVVGDWGALVEDAPSTVVVVWPGSVEPVVDVVSAPSPVQAAATSTKTAKRGDSRRTIRSQIIGGQELDLTNQVAKATCGSYPFV